MHCFARPPTATKRRHVERRRAHVAGALACGLLLGACGGSASGEGASSTTDPTTTTTTPTATTIEFQIAQTQFETLGDATVPVDDELTDAVESTLEEYATRATLEPLRDGELASGIESLFDAAIAGGVAPGGADRAAMTDEAVPAATGEITVEVEPVVLSGLQDGLGGYVLAAATFDYSVTAEVEGEPLTINRFGDLYFRDGEDGWVVSAYDVAVTRLTDDGSETARGTAGDTQGADS